MTPFVKICGLTTIEAAEAVAQSGAAMGGFMFYEKSPRYIGSFEKAKTIAEALGPDVGRVAVTVNADDAYLDAIVDALEPDYLQLHGSEDAARIDAVKARFRLPVIKVCSISTEADVEFAKGFESHADLMMFDAKAPAGEDRPGGWGEVFDWDLLTEVEWQRPWLLAGGLNAANVALAINAANPPGLDLSSGVESAPGVKSPQMILEFMRAVHAAGQDTDQDTEE